MTDNKVKEYVCCGLGEFQKTTSFSDGYETDNEGEYSNKFEKDYWGLTNLNAIRYILSNDKRNKIVIVGVENSRIDFAMLKLTQSEKDRIILKKIDEVDQKKVDYYISHFNDKKSANYYINNGFKIIKTIKVGNEEINIIFTN